MVPSLISPVATSTSKSTEEWSVAAPVQSAIIKHSSSSSRAHRHAQKRDQFSSRVEHSRVVSADMVRPKREKNSFQKLLLVSCCSFRLSPRKSVLVNRRNAHTFARSAVHSHNYANNQYRKTQSQRSNCCAHVAHINLTNILSHQHTKEVYGEALHALSHTRTSRVMALTH